LNRDCHDNLTAHHLSLDVSVSIETLWDIDILRVAA
jgi:hypothetical protein